MRNKKNRTQLHQGGLSHWKTLSNRKITQTQKLKLKPQIKINQSNTKTDPLTKIVAFIKNSKENSTKYQNNTNLAARIENPNQNKPKQ